jgi:tetratricopeptide (TPR) repeat protein
MLETIREYAAERLHEAGEFEPSSHKHADWLAIGLERTLGYVGSGRLEDVAVEAVAREQDNVGAAIDWAWASGHSELGLRLGAAATRYWRATGLFRVAVSWLERARSRIADVDPGLQLQALKAAVLIEAWARADAEAASRCIEEAMPLAEELGSTADVVWLTHLWAQLSWQLGDLSAAENLLERTLAQHREVGDSFGEALVLSDLGQVHRDVGKHESAAQLLEASVTLFRELGERGQLSETLHALGDLALDRGDLDAARRYYAEAIDITPDEPRVAGYCLSGLAAVLARQRKPQQAATLWGAVMAAEDLLGFRMAPAERHRYETDLDALCGTQEWTAGRGLTLQDAILLARQYVGIEPLG